MDSPTPKKQGRSRDLVWADVNIDEDGVVYCLKCEARIHTLGMTHVERVQAHFNNKCAKRACQSTVAIYFPSTLSDSVQDQFEKMLALWPCQSPFPARAQGTLLDKCYQESLDQLHVTLARQNVTLVSDAWTDINYVATSGNDTFFLESVYTGSESHDTSILANDISRVMQKYGFIRFVAVVTDNTLANRNAWKILRKKYPEVFFHGCAAHI